MRTNFAVCLGLIIIAACTHPGCEIFCPGAGAPGGRHLTACGDAPRKPEPLPAPRPDHPADYPRRASFAFDPPQAPVWASLHPGVTLEKCASSPALNAAPRPSRKPPF